MTESSRAARVLVIDDSDVVRHLIRINLELEGLEVVEADSGAAAEEWLAEVDVVTLDLTLATGPGGLEVLRRIRSDPALNATRVVVVTAAARPEDVRRGALAGADAYVTKPFEPDELVDVVRGLLPAGRGGVADFRGGFVGG